MQKPVAVIVGVGSGLSASLARALAPTHALTLAARDTEKLAALVEETGATAVALDATDAASTAALFDDLPAPPRLVVYNPSYRTRGPLADLDPGDVRRALDVTAFGAFLTGQAAARAMLSAEPEGGGRGTIIFTGASAGAKGFARSAPFAMGKFAQRGLAESMARELHPEGIHVVWVNIDGAIRNPGVDPGQPDSKLDPDAIAAEYLRLAAQPRSVWSHEATLRPWVERF
jgi:NAD(P)-dependent dehydrogenase (short-subunit alcohol dehydrogenase family)